MKQLNLFGQEMNPANEPNKYATSVEAPVYTPKGKKPHVMELVDQTKAFALIKEIEDSDIPWAEQLFLIAAAMRHNVFNYEQIAEYYTHSSKEMQELMEKSGLVIIDFNKAIECGFVRLCEDIRRQYMEDYGQ
jgi:hypothetical protein